MIVKWRKIPNFVREGVESPAAPVVLDIILITLDDILKRAMYSGFDCKLQIYFVVMTGSWNCFKDTLCILKNIKSWNLEIVLRFIRTFTNDKLNFNSFWIYSLLSLWTISTTWLGTNQFLVRITWMSSSGFGLSMILPLRKYSLAVHKWNAISSKTNSMFMSTFSTPNEIGKIKDKLSMNMNNGLELCRFISIAAFS